MIVAVVELPWGVRKRGRDEVISQSLEAAKIYHKVTGLKRKYFLNGDAGGGGVYIFETREDATAWFHDGWADWMEGRQGVRPTLKLFDCVLTLDNDAGEVCVDGKAVPKPWETDADR